MPSPKSSRTRSSVPQSDGGSIPGGSGACLAITEKKTSPSGVQFAIPIRPPGRQTRRSSAAVFGWSGANIAPKVESTTSNDASSNGSSWASPSTNSTSSPSAAARSRPFASSSGHVVDPDGLAEPPGRGQRGVAAPAGDVEDPLAGEQLHRLAQVLADDLGAVADLGEVPRDQTCC